jgi:hypothetical protein
MTNRNNISFESDCPVTIDNNGENHITLSNGQQASAGRTLKTLGSLTQKSNEPIINAIIMQWFDGIGWIPKPYNMAQGQVAWFIFTRWNSRWVSFFTFLLLFIIMFGNLFLFCCFAYIRYNPVASRAFQQKMKVAEDEAKLRWLPGGHSRGPSEDGEVLPDWIKVFHRYFEEKENSQSRTEKQEQAIMELSPLF